MGRFFAFDPCGAALFVPRVLATPFELVILAAGMGSRFGGLKQVEPVGPAGELIIEYSIFDARRAGCDRLVLVIRRDIEKEFRASIGRRLESRIAVDYVFQEMSDLPAGFSVAVREKLPARTKPWGTGHAVLAARHVVRRPFAVINADDFYGASGYRALADFFARGRDHALVGYPLRQTLSEHGTVSRGVCHTDARGRLRGITEVTKIEQRGDTVVCPGDGGVERVLRGDEVVSMNFWGFQPSIMGHLERRFARFVVDRGLDTKAEFYLPTAVSQLIESGEAGVELLRSGDAWFGMTYREDVATSRRAVAELVRRGGYPAPLWG